ncbi:MAG: protein kinase [Deltaproteobacteria bacterium]|nr:protein kinase [Deltaproteobacteria bacterium]
MGSVYSALHLTTQRKVALKFLKNEYCADGVVVARFIREARAAGTLDHPNTIQIIDVAQDDSGAPMLVMEYLEGETLAAAVHRGRLSITQTAHIMVPVLSALAHAHAHGIVHRDMKPENIFLARRGGELVPKILDFGIAKVLKDDEQPNKMTLTSTGTMLGTPYYMSPEQVAGRKDLDHRCDIWAMGVILYELLTGRKPFMGENFGQLFAALLQDEPPLITTLVPSIPTDVARVIHRCLAKRRDDRIDNAGEVATALAPHASLDAPNLPRPITSSGAFRAPTPSAGHRFTPASGAHALPVSTPVAVRGVYTPSGVRSMGTPVPLDATPPGAPGTPMRWSTPGATAVREEPRESSSASRTLVLVGVLGGLTAVATVIVLAAAGVFDSGTEPVAAADPTTLATSQPPVVDRTGSVVGAGGTASTNLDPNRVIQVVEATQSRPQLATCYADARRGDPSLAGRLVVSIDIGGDGSALSVRAVEGIEDVVLRRCVERELLTHLQIDGWQGGPLAGVRVPLQFAAPLVNALLLADAGVAQPPSQAGGGTRPRVVRRGGGGMDRPGPVGPIALPPPDRPPPIRPPQTGGGPSSSGIIREMP